MLLLLPGSIRKLSLQVILDVGLLNLKIDTQEYLHAPMWPFKGKGPTVFF